MFRLLLAVLVMVFHSVAFLTIGHYAVYVFFVLSGYWITKMYIEKYSLFTKPYWVYIQSRLFRLLPVYWVILLLAMLVKLAQSYLSLSNHEPTFNAETIFLNFILLGLIHADFKFLVPSWSLDIELQFYLIAPLLVGLFSTKRSVILVLALSVLCCIISFSSPYSLEFLNLIGYLPWFGIGSIIYLYNVKFPDYAAFLCLLAGGFLLAIHYGIPALRLTYLLNKQATVYGFNYQEFINLILTILTIPFITLNVRQKVDPQKDHLYSSMSYILYLLHWPLLQIYAQSVTQLGALQKTIYLLVYFTATLLFSYFLSVYVDNYFERSRRRWLCRQKKTSPEKASPLYVKLTN